ncbi:hypothetical protein [Enterococcus sp. DIV0421]|uniref:hypothetical protein n=1 Tax=Enterococcus sp. DIV0421 TaxID=2774688 RepID=UPI003F686679
MKTFDELIQKAHQLGLTISPKVKYVDFTFDGMTISGQKLRDNVFYSVFYFQDYFDNKREVDLLEGDWLHQFKYYQEEK